MLTERNVIFREELSFDLLLDVVCERLREKHVEFSIRRINEMDEELAKFEKELDELTRLGRFA